MARNVKTKKSKVSANKKNVKRAGTRKVKKLAPAKRKKKVMAIPKGYNSITPYLIVNQAAKAIEFYKKAFKAKVVMQMEHPGGKIGHAELKIGDTKIMLADEYPDMGALAPKAYGGSPVSIHLYVKNVDDIMENALKLGANLVRPVENMFYGDRAGTLLDPYGHKWHVSTHVENVTPAKVKKRMAEMFAKKDARK